MSQYDPTFIGSMSGTALAVALASWEEALLSSHSGASRPAYAVEGTVWLDVSGGATSYRLKFFDGTDDITLLTINTTANSVSMSGVLTTITGLSSISGAGGLASGDEFIVYDLSATDNKKVTYAQMVQYISALTQLTAPATDDKLPIRDESAVAGTYITLSDLFKVINQFTADTAPDAAADYVVTWDNSASGPKKVLLSKLGIGKQSIWVPASAMIPPQTSGAAQGATEFATNDVNIQSLDFDAAAIEYAQFWVAMPKGWDVGTFTAKFFWTATNTGNVVWGIEAVAISNDDAMDASITGGTAQEVTDGVTAANDLMVSDETSALTANGTAAAEDLVLFQVYRNATSGSDTCAVDAKLIGLRLHYTTSSSTDV